jgi:phage shock protein PspC (stress-responsive transcriptional regulator)
MLRILRSIFRTLIALIILLSCLPIFALIFIHYFIVGFIAEENKKNEDISEY